jgi:hypothetical protein
MKKQQFTNRWIQKVLVGGALCTALTSQVFAKDASIVPIASEATIIPISARVHWADEAISELAQINGQAHMFFGGKDLNKNITIEDFQNLVKLVINPSYEGAPEALTREAVVHELTKLFANESGLALENIPVIKMIIYQDTEQIDSKYNHSATVAYMKGIAKGKGDGIFAPKANVTYGELAAMINNTKKAIKEQAPDQSIAAGRFETRASYELQKDKIVFDFELMSHFAEPKELMFGSGQQFEVTVTNEKGEEVYRFSDGKAFTLALIFQTINPGQAFRWQDDWNLTDKEGNRVAAGNYTATIRVLTVSAEEGHEIPEKDLTVVLPFSL